ncbi:centromere protein X isoform X1 [Tachysurus vachellii]|uniref:centromere protein X isoform X1 n=1 Tax=Tachysurus vachellii TaxID=175792 RepID=UPI00296B52E5|nr:centromere protein X isoform X1 [Tachysurus vachellii]
MVDQAREVIFKKETVSKLLMLFFKDGKSKVSNDSVSLMAEMLRIFVIEATRRAIKHAENEDCVGVDLEHVERILPQLPHVLCELLLQNINQGPLASHFRVLV